MSIIAKSGDSKPREIIPADNYVARCYRMIHVGTNFSEMFDKHINKVRVTWELPTETRVFDEEKGQQPFVIDAEYTLSMHEKSNLRKALESWRGKGFTEEEAKGFDITKLVGKYCMLNVIHNEAKNGNTYANVGSIAKVPKGMELPDGYNPDFIFDYDNNFDMEFVETLPDFIKPQIKSSIEWNEKMAELEGTEFDKALDAKINDDKDDLPF